MYERIDELVEAIVHDDVFQSYVHANHMLENEDVKMLLHQHQLLQEDYSRYKQYEQYVSLDEMKKSLNDVNQQMLTHPIIQNYYSCYYQLNELLDEVTQCVFQNISHDLNMGRWKL